jgi:hypothetical protein
MAGRQLCPQEPQLFASVDVSTHALPPHIWVPDGQTQPPFEQVEPVSVDVQSVHVAPPVPHEVGVSLPTASHVVALLQQPAQPELVLHVQVPPMHVVPDPQILPHAPQLALSVE